MAGFSPLGEQEYTEEDPGDAYTEDDYKALNNNIAPLSGSVCLDKSNVLTVQGRSFKLSEDDVDNHLQALDYDKPVMFDDLSERTQEAVSTIYNGTRVMGSYW